MFAMNWDYSVDIYEDGDFQNKVQSVEFDLSLACRRGRERNKNGSCK